MDETCDLVTLWTASPCFSFPDISSTYFKYFFQQVSSHREFMVELLPLGKIYLTHQWHEASPWMDLGALVLSNQRWDQGLCGATHGRVGRVQNKHQNNIKHSGLKLFRVYGAIFKMCSFSCLVYKALKPCPGHSWHLNEYWFCCEMLQWLRSSQHQPVFSQAAASWSTLEIRMSPVV